MSGAISGAPVGHGLLGTLIANSGNVRGQLDTLTIQISTGLISTSYAGLGRGAGVALNLAPQVAALKTWQANIDAASGQMTVTQTAMAQIEKITVDFAGKMPNLNGLNPSEVDSVAFSARAALAQVADLLDTRNGDTYVFAGQDSANPPVPSPGDILSSGFYTQINAAVTSLSTAGAAATAAATLGIAASDVPGTSPFSAYLSQPVSAIAVPTIDTGGANLVATGMLASANAAVASLGSSTTGSYMRDLMRALGTLGSLSSGQTSDPNFAALVLDTQTSLNGVVTAMAGDAGVLGDRQAALTAQQANMAAMATALSQQISEVQDVDLAATLSKLTSTQIQLQASYKLITSENSMSLINFLPAG